jgi:hypothetical protein
MNGEINLPPAFIPPEAYQAVCEAVDAGEVDWALC